MRSAPSFVSETPGVSAYRSANSLPTFHRTLRSIALAVTCLLQVSDQHGQAQEVKTEVRKMEQEDTLEVGYESRIAHWVTSKEVQEIKGKVEQGIRMMDEDKFVNRQEGSRIVYAALQELHERIHPLPPDIQSYFPPELFREVGRQERQQGNDHLSLEQRERMKVVRLGVSTKCRTYEPRILPGEYSEKELLRAVATATGMNTTELQGLFGVEKIVIDKNSNRWQEILNKRLMQLGYGIRFDPETTSLSLCKEKEKKLLLDGNMMRRVTTDASGTESVDLALVPTVGRLLVLGEHEQPSKNVSIGALQGDEWLFVCGTNPRKKINAKDQAEKKEAIELWLAMGLSEKANIPFGHSEKLNDAMDIHAQAKEVEGTWNVRIVLHILGGVPWPATTCFEDSVTYAYADANRYIFRDANNTIIPSHMRKATVNQRLIEIEFSLEKEPTNYSVQFYDHVETQKVRLP